MKIFSVETKEAMIELLVEVQVECNGGSTDDLRAIMLYGFRGIETYTDEELYDAVQDTYCWQDDEPGITELRKTDGEFELYRAVESEYAIYKMLTTKKKAKKRKVA
jgi:hypothetical protein